MFNGRVWPDFIGMSEHGPPFVKLELLEPERPVQAAGLRITPLAVDHVVPTLGFLVESNGVMVAIPSDTGPTDAIWREAGASPHLKAVFLEASFPNAMSELASISGHLTPATFAAEARKLARPSTVRRGAYQAAVLRTGCGRAERARHARAANRPAGRDL